MLLFFLSAVAAEPQEATRAPVGPEPVYALADKDLKRLREARVAQFASITLPAVFLAGTFAQAQILPDPETGIVPVNAQSVFAGSMYLVGGLGMIAASTTLQHLAIRSTKHLRAQGLEVRRMPAAVVPTLATVGVVIALGAGRVPTASQQLNNQGLVLGLGLYAVSVGVGTVQLDINRRARRRAGWIGLAPMVDRDASGLAVVGRW